MLRSILVLSLLMFFGLALWSAPKQKRQDVKPLVIDVNAKFENFILSWCQNTSCFQLKAPAAVESKLFHRMSFSEGSFLMKTADQSRSLKVEGHYDPLAQRIYFTRVYDQSFTQAWFDIKKQELTVL